MSNVTLEVVEPGSNTITFNVLPPVGSGTGFQTPDLLTADEVTFVGHKNYSTKSLQKTVERIIDNLTAAIGDDKEFRHVQINPMSEWSLDHNLNAIPSTILLLDELNNYVIPSILELTNTRIVLSFAYQAKGTLILKG